MSKQSPERLEYLRNYRKNHKEQQRKYQRKYIDKLRQQGKYPISTSMKLRNEIEKLQQELQRKDNNWNELKKYLEYEIEEWQDVSGVWIKAQVQEDKIILDKIKELEENK